MRRFLVNCDDLGMHPTINEAIVRLLSDGIIKSASIMAPALHFTDAVNRLNAAGITRIGVHLTVNSEYPALPIGPLTESAQSLIEDEYSRTFFDCPTKTRKRAFSSELKAELAAQIAKVLSCGLEISHLDGHMFFYEPHIAGPGYLEIVKELGKKLGVPVRSIKEEGFALPRKTHFIWEEFDSEGDRHNAYRKILLDSRNTLDEIIIHPGIRLDHLAEFTNAGIRRYADFTFFASPKFKEIIKKNDLEIISWDQLAETR